MLTDVKKIQADNRRELLAAQQMLAQRASNEPNCFESILSLNRAALTMCLAPELDENDLVAMGEVLMIQSALIKAAFAHYRLRGEGCTNE